MEGKIDLAKALDYLVTRHSLEENIEYLLYDYAKAVMGDIVIFFYEDIREFAPPNGAFYKREIRDDYLWVLTEFRKFLDSYITSYIEEKSSKEK